MIYIPKKKSNPCYHKKEKTIQTKFYYYVVLLILSFLSRNSLDLSSSLPQEITSNVGLKTLRKIVLFINV
jgi:hypothetical protein